MQIKQLIVAMILAALSMSPAVRSDAPTVGEVMKVDGPTGTITVKHGPLRVWG
jgi:Cu/Ag efflux protein CusF